MFGNPERLCTAAENPRGASVVGLLWVLIELQGDEIQKRANADG
jgi:hypothetical protein